MKGMVDGLHIMLEMPPSGYIAQTSFVDHVNMPALDKTGMLRAGEGT